MQLAERALTEALASAPEGGGPRLTQLDLDLALHRLDAAERGIEALVATGAGGRRRRHDFRPTRAREAANEPKADWLQAMAAKRASEEGRALYQRRQQTVEPVFGIIKAVLGCRGFSLRGLDEVAGAGRSGLRRQTPAQAPAGDGLVRASCRRPAVPSARMVPSGATHPPSAADVPSVAPIPSVTSIRPPCASTIVTLIARPSPNPSCLVVTKA